MNCAEFPLGCISATGLMDKLPQLRAGCRPVQLLVYHRASSGLANTAWQQAGTRGRQHIPTLAQKAEEFGLGQSVAVGGRSDLMPLPLLLLFSTV